MGVINLVGPDRLDRFSFALAACRTFGLDERLIVSRPTADLKQCSAPTIEGRTDQFARLPHVKHSVARRGGRLARNASCVEDRSGRGTPIG